MKTSAILDTLRFIKSPLIALKGQGKPYDNLIDLIVALPGYNDYDYDENEEAPEIPNGKQMQATLKITAATFRRWMVSLYDDLLASVQDKGIEFPEYQVYFSVEGPTGRYFFGAKLALLPRTGEGIHFPFLDPIVGRAPLFVQDTFTICMKILKLVY